MSLPLPNADLPPFSCFSSEQQQQQKPQQEIMDSMAISALEQFRSAPQPLTSPQKLWGSLPKDHSHHYRYHDPAPRENTGLGLGMGMGIGMDMSMAAMAAAAAAGMSMGNLVPLSQDPNSMPPWSIMDSTLTPIPMSMSMGIESLAVKTTPIATAGNSSELLSFALTPAKSKIGSGDVGWSLHNSHQQQQQEHGQRRWQQLEQQQQFQAAVAEERNSDNTKVTKQESSHNHNDKDVVDSVPRYAYRECRRNHAAHKGSTVVLDGCCNFMPQLELDDHDHDQNDEKQRQGPLAMLCGACGCHRNFHRRVALTKDGMDMDMDMDMDADDTTTTTTQERPRRSLGECVATIKDVANSVALCVTNTLLLLDMDLNSASFIKSLECLRSAATSMLAAADCLSTLQSAEGRHEPPSSSSWKVHLAKLNRHSSSRQNGYDKKAEFCGSSKQKVVKEKEKRKRTRFSAEQIRKLNDFGSEVGWTLAGLSKHHIEGVCAHIGIEATTLKYWLYNTRQKSKRRSSSSSSAIPAALPSTSASPPPFSEQHQEHVEAADKI